MNDIIYNYCGRLAHMLMTVRTSNLIDIDCICSDIMPLIHFPLELSQMKPNQNKNQYINMNPLK